MSTIVERLKPEVSVTGFGCKSSGFGKQRRSLPMTTTQIMNRRSVQCCFGPQPQSDFLIGKGVASTKQLVKSLLSSREVTRHYPNVGPAQSEACGGERVVRALVSGQRLGQQTFRFSDLAGLSGYLSTNMGQTSIEA